MASSRALAAPVPPPPARQKKLDYGTLLPTTPAGEEEAAAAAIGAAPKRRLMPGWACLVLFVLLYSGIYAHVCTHPYCFLPRSNHGLIDRSNQTPTRPNHTLSPANNAVLAKFLARGPPFTICSVMCLGNFLGCVSLYPVFWRQITWAHIRCFFAAVCVSLCCGLGMMTCVFASLKTL